MPDNKPSRRKPGNGDHVPKSPAAPPPATAVPTQTAQPTRLRILGDVEEGMRDQYLLDAMRQYKIVLADLATQTDPARVENDVYVLCELSRDATIRLTPFSAGMRRVFEYVLEQFRTTLRHLQSKELSEPTKRYRDNIQKRIDEFEKFLKQVPAGQSK